MDARVGEGTVTPEAVQVSVDVAGLGSRSIAFLLDTVIQVGVAIPLAIGAGAVIGATGADETVAFILFSLVIFLIVWAYYPLFETLWNGRTPGKRAQRLRVVRTDGQPVTFAPVMVRELVRIVDVILFPFLGVISMLVTRRSQRLGDLAAGTMVVREHRAPSPAPLELDPPRPGAPASAGVDASALVEREYDLIRSFLSRRQALDPAARTALASRLAALVRSRVGTGPPGAGDEALLESVARAYRDRFRPRS